MSHIVLDTPTQLAGKLIYTGWVTCHCCHKATKKFHIIKFDGASDVYHCIDCIEKIKSGEITGKINIKYKYKMTKINN